jgi:pyruvate ferredoxin oxidoreductase gamma subunit
LNGIGPKTLLLVVSDESADTWRERLNLAGPIVILPPLAESGHGKMPLVSAACAGAAAALTGVIGMDNLLAAIGDELGSLREETVNANRAVAAQAFAAMRQNTVRMTQLPAVSPDDYRKPAWLDLPADAAILAAPTVHGALTGDRVKTGLWRTQRPVIDYARCKRCWWVCGSFCPDGVIKMRADGAPEIDYEHCKGCMICVAQCPAHAIEALAEAEARQEARP